MIRHLAGRIFLVEGNKGGRYPYAHSLYVRDGGGVLVDCGSDLDAIRWLAAHEGLAAILMTHYHEDHFLFLHRFPDVPVWASDADAPALESKNVLLSRYGVAGTAEEPFFRKLFREKFPFRPRKVARRLGDRRPVRFGRTDVVPIVAPGHTPGHLCLHFPSEGVLFLADYDLSAFGPWYGDNPGGIGEFRRSARMLARVETALHVVSHGAAVHAGAIGNKMEEYLSVIDRRDEALRTFLKRPRTRAEIVARRIVYGRKRRGPWFDYGEWALLRKHIDEMAAQGELVVEGDRYRVGRGRSCTPGTLLSRRAGTLLSRGKE